MTEPILEILRQILAFELITINIVVWILADTNRPKKRVYKVGEFVPYKP
jgi:hypothetical protein